MYTVDKRKTSRYPCMSFCVLHLYLVELYIRQQGIIGLTTSYWLPVLQTF